MLHSQSKQAEKVIVKVDAEIEDIIPIFFETLAEEMETALDALQRDDYETIQIWGHSLKGAVASDSRPVARVTSLADRVTTGAEAVLDSGGDRVAVHKEGEVSDPCRATVQVHHHLGHRQ